MSTGKLMSAGIFSAIAASLCCITPVLALVAGTGGIASSFTWIEPARPYLIGLTVAVLGFAWYLKLRPKPVDECGCEVEEKPKFFQSKKFLLLITLFAGLMISFPSYAKIFFPTNEKAVSVTDNSSIQTIEVNIKGMTCEACELEVNHEINKLPGIIRSVVSYEKRNATVKFDNSKSTVKDVLVAISGTGYKVVNHSIKN
jgi:mercuric ion transport protein